MSKECYLSIFPVDDSIKILVSSRERIISVDIVLTVDDARWLAEHLTHTVNAIADTPKSEATER